MTVEQRTIVHENALVFVQEVEKAIHSGLRITDTNQGAPYLNAVLKEVLMVPAESAIAGPAHLTKYAVEDDGETVIVEGYEGLVVLLTLQEVVLAGFTVQAVDFMPHGVKSIVLKRAAKAAAKVSAPVAPVLDEALVAPAPVKTPTAPAKTGRARTKTK